MRRPRRKRFRWLLPIGGVELAQIARHALLDLLQPALHLRTREILVARVHRLELAAVNRHARARQQTKLSAKRNEPRTYLADRRAVILAEVSNRLVIGNQSTGEPHHLNVAPTLTLEPTARLNAIEIAVDVQLQQDRGMVGRPSGCFRINATETELRQIKLLDKYVDCANRIIFANPILQAFREQRTLPSIRPFNKPLHRSLRKSRRNHNLRITPASTFLHSLGHERPRRPDRVAVLCPLRSVCDRVAAP